MPASGGLTAPGTHLGFGQVATVRWVPPSTYNGQKAQRGLKLQVTVESIQKGSIGDFKNVDLNASERKSTPYYVTVRIKSLDSAPPPGTDDPAISLDAIDDRGQQRLLGGEVVVSLRAADPGGRAAAGSGGDGVRHAAA